VFKLPRDEHTDYIKRIIGLPGDRLQMRHGTLFLNGQPVKRERMEDYRSEDAGQGAMTARRYRETLPNGVSYYILEFTDSGALDNTPEYVVPEGHVFAMGDNRDRSLDSRVPADPAFGGVGYIPLDNLVGRAEIIFFSTNGSAHWWEVWKWPFAIRYHRLFTLIH
jgi:signal peptidase I